jgi:polyhydroxyalkanoate synthesis regulator phasin
MKTEAKVVQLGKAAASHASAVQPPRLAPPLAQVRDAALPQLKKSLQSLFDSADDTLFEMADRAANNSEQSLFFEAMRELRLKRHGIARDFLQRFLDAFGRLNQYEIGREPALEAPGYDNLALVQNDELEERVAVDSMVTKARGRLGIALSHLTARFNTLVSKKLEENNHPLGPEMLCEAFLLSCGQDMDIKVKLIVLKLFEKSCLDSLDPLYVDANQLLKEAGVLPELQSALPKRSAGRSGAPVAEHAQALPSIGEMGSDEAFGVLQQLLSQSRSVGRPAPAATVEALPITQQDLMRLLSHLQQSVPADALAEQTVDLRQQVDHLLSRASAKSGKTRVVDEVDDDVINLVAMLFEFILDDRTLPDSLKALIARLQIPMLKVAVLDKAFFSRTSHPARRLLNELATAALGWNDQDDARRDSLYQTVEAIVQRLLNEFVDDPRIFAELLDEFTAFRHAQSRRSELLEQRTRDAEEARAKTELARQHVEQALNTRMLGKTLPQVVVRLVHQGWSKVLLLTCLKHGIDSPGWRSNLIRLDELIWSVTLPEGVEARQRLRTLAPELLRSLRAGLDEAGVDAFAAQEWLGLLETFYRHVFKRLSRLAQANAMPGKLEADPVEQEQAPAEPAMVAVVEQLQLLSPGEQPAAAEPESPVDDQQALLQVDNLRVGSWLEIHKKDGQKLRCKLAAWIKPTGKYIFVNRNGMKVLEKTRNSLAAEFQRGAIRLLDDALLFDRALESVIGNLRRLKAE